MDCMIDSIDSDDRQSLGDLPESCIAQILCFASPQEIAKVACTCRAFRDAARSDMVWQAKLPKCYQEVLAEVTEAPAASSSKKYLYDFLCDGVFLGDGHQAFSLDKATGAVSRSQGSRGMSIVWSDDVRNWSWLAREGSSFPDVAYLKNVCWLEVGGQMECTLPVGNYSLFWRLSVPRNDQNTGENRTYYGWSHKPVIFNMETDGGLFSQRAYFLDPDRYQDEETVQGSQNSGRRVVDKNWTEFDVGDFTVEEGSPNSGVGRVNLKYKLLEIEGRQWKSGMFLDGAIIRSSHLKPSCSLVDTLTEEADS